MENSYLVTEDLEILRVRTFMPNDAKSKSIVALWERFGHFGASDARDGLYGILAVIVDDTVCGISLSYITVDHMPEQESGNPALETRWCRGW